MQVSSLEAPVSLPDFLVIGAPKAGTTALHAALARHPGLYLSAVKEPKFFLSDGRPRRRADLPRAHLAQAGVRGSVRRGPARHAARRVDPALPVRPGRDAPDPRDAPRGQADRGGP